MLTEVERILECFFARFVAGSGVLGQKLVIVGLPAIQGRFA